jgi:Zn-dependent protease with chaperone function
MISCRAFWYDGKLSERHLVTISCLGDRQLRVQGEGVDVSVPLADVRIDAALGTARRMMRFPDGAAAETSDHDFLDGLQKRQGRGRFFRTVSRWETSLLRTFAALVVMLALCLGLVRYALPVLAMKAAFALPSATEELIGRETLQVLDRAVLKPTKLSGERRRELTALFSAMKARYPGGAHWRLEFRSGKAVGANAFALPAGVVVITDRLVTLAKSDAELAGVLAHEIGHLNRRHALRNLMQNSATALVVATVTGDITSFTSLSAALPTMLIDAKYSRDFEDEADDAAVDYLRRAGVPVHAYADILTRIGNDHRQRAQEKDSSFGELFADHPMIEKRVRRVLSGRGD